MRVDIGYGQEDQPAAIKDDEAQGGAAQGQVTLGQGDQKEALANKSNGLHDDNLDERSVVFEGVKEGNEVRHIPHQEEDSHAAHHGCTGHTLQFKGGRIGGGIDNEHQSALHIEEEDNSDEETG